MKNEDLYNKILNTYIQLTGVKKDKVEDYLKKHSLKSLFTKDTSFNLSDNQRKKHILCMEFLKYNDLIHKDEIIITSPDDAANYFSMVFDDKTEKEHFYVAFLNTKNHVIGYEKISSGSLNSSIVHPRELFKPAIMNKAEFTRVNKIAGLFARPVRSGCR